MFVEVFALMVVVHLMTRRRTIPDIAGRAPERGRAARETALVLGYGIAAMAGGYLLGHAFGWHAFGFHLDGMVIRTGQPVVPNEAIAWATYNLFAYAVLPLVFFRRRYSADQLNLHSSDRWADLRLILVAAGHRVHGSVAAEPGPLPARRASDPARSATDVRALVARTVLPTMVFVYCILTPRFLRLTGSFTTTVILGGLTYAALHFFDGWTNTSPRPPTALLSTLYLLLFYTAPGMLETVPHAAHRQRLDACVGLPRDRAAHDDRYPDVRQDLRHPLTPKGAGK